MIYRFLLCIVVIQIFHHFLEEFSTQICHGTTVYMMSTALFSKSSELLLGDTVTGSVTPRFTERPPFFNVKIPTWTLTSFSTLSGSFSAFLLEMA